MRVLAGRLDRRLLAVCREEEPVWACWLGGGRPLEAEQALRALGEISLDRVLVSVGEPGEGLSGWRFSHRQAKAALPIAERRGQAVLRYADVALLASILRDDLVATSLHQLYLEPLESARDGGKVGRETLRAYFAAERNISSTAAALGVDRRTVTNRIRAIEGLFGRPLKDFATELETALRLDD
jgi:DNA-binding PucR family transcriptional regulator